MLTPRSSLSRRVIAALDASPARIPVLVGGCGSGKTTLLAQVRERLGRGGIETVDVERAATTPERFWRSLAGSGAGPEAAPAGPRAALDAALGVMNRQRPGGEPSTWLLDEFLELRTFESFPGLRRVLHDLVDDLTASGNRFVLTSRYPVRAARLLRDRAWRFDIIQMPSLTTGETLDLLGLGGANLSADDAHEATYTAQTVQALGDGRPAYVRAIADELIATRDRGGPGASDAVSALAAAFAPEGHLTKLCHFSYELRLHRARGYGALKAILDILAEDEGLTLTEISHRLERTPGSTKDYLSWLEDVDLVVARGKRYSYADPLLRVWVRIHGRPIAPSEEDLAREVHRFALPRLPQPPEPALVMAAAGGQAVSDGDRKDWGIIEID